MKANLNRGDRLSMANENRRAVARRLQLIDDKFEIYELIASHPSRAYNGFAEYTAADAPRQ